MKDISERLAVSITTEKMRTEKKHTHKDLGIRRIPVPIRYMAPVE